MWPTPWLQNALVFTDSALVSAMLLCPAQDFRSDLPGQSVRHTHFLHEGAARPAAEFAPQQNGEKRKRLCGFTWNRASSASRCILCTELRHSVDTNCQTCNYVLFGSATPRPAHSSHYTEYSPPVCVCVCVCVTGQHALPGSRAAEAPYSDIHSLSLGGLPLLVYRQCAARRVDVCDRCD